MNAPLFKLGGTYGDGWVYYSKNRIVIFILVFTFIVVLFENSELYYLNFKKSQPIWKRSARLVNYNLAEKKVRGRSQTTLTIFWPFLITYPPLLTVSTL
jgi:fumarate reductase subunit C